LINYSSLGKTGKAKKHTASSADSKPHIPALYKGAIVFSEQQRIHLTEPAAYSRNAQTATFSSKQQPKRPNLQETNPTTKWRIKLKSYITAETKVNK
jgi:hypothetical protein